MNATVSINGAGLTLDPSGAVFWAENSLLAVADLHLEKGSAFAAAGQLLPPYDSLRTLAALEDAIARYRPRAVICLGDSFHDARAADRLDAGAGRALAHLVGSADWVWISGNHDQEGLAALANRVGGEVREEIAEGPLVFRHEPQPAPSPGELAGHLHPAAVVRQRGRRLRRRCFVGDGSRLILPSFGAYTGGLDVFDEAFDGLFAVPRTAWLLGQDRVYAMKEDKLART